MSVSIGFIGDKNVDRTSFIDSILSNNIHPSNNYSMFGQNDYVSTVSVNKIKPLYGNEEKTSYYPRNKKKGKLKKIINMVSSLFIKKDQKQYHTEIDIKLINISNMYSDGFYSEYEI